MGRTNSSSAFEINSSRLSRPQHQIQCEKATGKDSYEAQSVRSFEDVRAAFNASDRRMFLYHEGEAGPSRPLLLYCVEIVMPHSLQTFVGVSSA